MFRALSASLLFSTAIVLLFGSSVSADLADNIIFYSPLDNIDTPSEYFWEDVSGNGYHVDNVLAPSYDDGASHTSAVECNGAEATRMSVANGLNSDLDAAISDFSVSCWVHQSSSSIAWIMDKGAWATGKQSGWTFMSVNGTPAFRVMGVGDDGSNQITLTDSNVDLTDGWHMLTGVLDRTGSVSGTVDNMLFYVDGQLATSQVLPYINSAPMDISNSGAEFFMGGRPATSYNFNGYLDDVAIYDTALSATDVQTLYSTTTLTASTLSGATPLVIHNFEATYGGDPPEVPEVIGDNIGEFWDGTPATDPTRGDVLNFNGSSTARVEYGKILPLGDGSRTISLWLKADAPSGAQYVASDGNAGSLYPGWSVFLSDGDLFVRANINNEISDTNSVATYYDEGVTDGAWHHLAFTIDNDGGILTAYLDGQSSGTDGQANGWGVGRGGADTVLFSPGSTCAENDSLFLGVDANAINGFEGMIDDFVMWDRVLTAAEILSIYSGTAIPTEATPDRIPGDANEDGKVDGSDVTILANHWQHGVDMAEPDADWTMGDFNGDGKVDGSDVTILASHWQEGTTSTTASVPEPSMLMLLFMAIGTWLVWRRQ